MGGTGPAESCRWRIPGRGAFIWATRRAGLPTHRWLAKLHRLGAVVRPEHRPVLRGPKRRTDSKALAATHIEHGPVPQALDHRPVTPPRAGPAASPASRPAWDASPVSRFAGRGAPVRVGGTRCPGRGGWFPSPDGLLACFPWVIPSFLVATMQPPSSGCLQLPSTRAGTRNQFLGPAWPAPLGRWGAALRPSSGRPVASRSALDYTVIALFAFVPIAGPPSRAR